MLLDDLDDVMTVERLANQTPWSRLGYEKELRFNDLAAYQVVTVACAGREPLLVGYGGYWLIAGEGHISIVAVHPGWRGHGLGELLLTNMLWLITESGAALATLEVRDSNKVAQNLYEKAGFKLVGRRKHYYKDSQEDALIMTLEPLDETYRQTLRERWSQLVRRLGQNVPAAQGQR